MNSTVVLLPVYNEARMVGDVVAELRNSFDDVVCIDDGSHDGSGQVARAAGASVVTHRVNLGQGAALRTGFDLLSRRPGIRHVITFDADGQHAVDDAAAMLEVARTTDIDVVLGSRFAGATSGQPLAKRLILRSAVRVSRWSTGLSLTDTHNGLRVLNLHALRTLTLRQRGMAHASEIEALIARHGLTWVEHPVTISYSAYSRSKGQGNLNAFNIAYDLATARLHAPS